MKTIGWVTIKLVAEITALAFLCGCGYSEVSEPKTISRPHEQKDAEKAQKQEVDAAREAADAWLQLVDSGNSAESWDEAGDDFKSDMTQAQWPEGLRRIRQALGQPIGRTVKSHNSCTSPPDGNARKCIEIQYETSVTSIWKTAVEVVDVMKDKDGKWRVSDYFICPGDYHLDEQSFDAEALKVVEGTTGILLPAGSRGLNMSYKGYAIDPSLMAKVEIPGASQEILAKHIEQMQSFGDIECFESRNKLSWWNLSEATIHVKRSVATSDPPGRGCIFLCEENGRWILYVDWAQI